VVPTTAFLNPGQVPIEFVVRYSTDQIHEALDYVLLGSIGDGPNVWIMEHGAPVITHGNPTTDLTLVLTYRPDLALGEVSGTFTGLPETLSLDARWEAFLVRADTGEVVAYDARWIEDPANVTFAVPFDVETIDATVAYLVTGRVLDGDQVWSGPGAPAVTLGAPFTGIELPLTLETGPGGVLVEPEAPGSPIPSILLAPTGASPSP
jgi:uncharacterized lipoprotein YbaY